MTTRRHRGRPCCRPQTRSQIRLWICGPLQSIPILLRSETYPAPACVPLLLPLFHSTHDNYYDSGAYPISSRPELKSHSETALTARYCILGRNSKVRTYVCGVVCSRSFEYYLGFTACMTHCSAIVTRRWLISLYVYEVVVTFNVKHRLCFLLSLPSAIQKRLKMGLL